MSSEEVKVEPVNTGTEMMTTAASGTGGAGSAKTPDANLADELREFGKQIETMFQTARNSSRGKEIEMQLTAAWRDVEKGVNNAINKTQSSDIKGTVSGTAQYASDEVQSGLARGLHSLNQWMSQKSQEAEARRKKREADIAAGATMGTAENEVTDRFGSDAPVFGQGVQVPAVQVNVTPDPKALDADNPLADRFTN